MDDTTTVGIESLDAHRRLTADALVDLRALHEAARRWSIPEVETRTAEVIRRVEEDVFRVAVVGEFKRGKSTLINAMLGQEVLPADVLPCSATLNRVTYGLTPTVRLVFKPDAAGHRREEQIPVEALGDYVTRLTPDSEARASDIEEAVVYHPLRFCRDKADIIDTPGLNDDEAMTRVTLGVLPQVDAAIFVILAQSPFSGYEAEFLNRLLTHELGRVIFVVNRMDEIRREPDKARILQVVRDRIAKGVRARAAELHGEGTAEAEALIARIGSPKVFGVAGAVALDAKLAGDQAALDRSGFPAFEAALERFLALERGVVTLLVMADAAIAAARKLQAQASIRKGALSMRTDEFEAAWQKTSAELDGLRAQLAVELGRIQQASHTLRAELRPRAGQLSKVLVAETHAVIDAFPLDADAVSRAKASATAEKMSAAVRERLLAVARRESERVQGEIEAALQQQVAELQDFGAQMEAALAAIELRFSATPTADEGLGAGVTAGAGAVTSAVGGWLLGGALSGAFTGYQVAGIRGAAAGAAAGAAVGFGTVMTGGLIIAALGLPVTFPVVLPMLVIAGLASSFGARWFTRFIFSDEQLTRFREAFRREVVGQLEAAAPARTAELEASTEQQVRSAFAALQKQVETELGGVITTTQRTLDDLRTQRTRAAARSETELAELEATVAQAAAIEARMRALSTALRAMQSPETQERS